MFIRFWIKKRNRSKLQLTAAVVAVSFLFTTLSAPFAQANLWEDRQKAVKELRNNNETLLAQLPAVNQNILPTLGRHSGESRNLVNDQFFLDSGFRRNDGLEKHLQWATSLPLNYATLKKATIPPSWKVGDPVVVYIQDAHLNKDAQTNIGKSIQHFIDNGKLDLVALEGAFEPIDLSRFRSFPNQDAVHKVADYLLKENKISGSIHTAFTSVQEIPTFIGVDDRQHYDANVAAYKNSFPKVPQYKEKIAELEKTLEEEKLTQFNPKLLELDKGVQSYRDGKEKLGSYIQLLVKKGTVPSGTVPFFTPDRHSRFSVRHSGESRNPEVNRFLKALKMESSLDFPKVEKERSTLLQKLTQNLSKPQMTELLNASLAYQLGNVKNTDFYLYLKDLCQKNGVNFKEFPGMDSYIQYALLSDQINADKLFEEVKQMEENAYNSLAKTEDEKRLVTQSKYIHLVSKLINSSLTREEWQEYVKISTDRHLGAFDRHSGESRNLANITSLLDSGFRRNDDQNIDLSSFENFYKESIIRDEAMASNLMHAIKEKNAKATILVTGGFHSEGIEERLKKSNIAVFTYTPKISQVDTENGSTYLSVFTQEKTPLEKLFDGEKLFLPPEVLSKGAIRTGAALLSEGDNTTFQQLTDPKIGKGFKVNKIKEDIEVTGPHEDKIRFSIENGEIKVLEIKRALLATTAALLVHLYTLYFGIPESANLMSAITFVTLLLIRFPFPFPPTTQWVYEKLGSDPTLGLSPISQWIQIQGDIQGSSKGLTLAELEGYYKLLKSALGVFPQQVPFLKEFEQLYTHFKEHTISPEELESLGAAIQKIEEVISQSIVQERERDLIRLRFFENKSRDQTAQEFSALHTQVTPERIRQIEERFLRKFRNPKFWPQAQEELKIVPVPTQIPAIVSQPLSSPSTDSLQNLEIRHKLRDNIIQLIERYGVKTISELKLKTFKEIEAIVGERLAPFVEKAIMEFELKWIANNSSDDIRKLDIPTYIITSLGRAGIFTISKLRTKNKEQLLKISGIGEKAISIIKTALFKDSMINLLNENYEIGKVENIELVKNDPVGSTFLVETVDKDNSKERFYLKARKISSELLDFEINLRKAWHKTGYVREFIKTKDQKYFVQYENAIVTLDVSSWGRVGKWNEINLYQISGTAYAQAKLHDASISLVSSPFLPEWLGFNYVILLDHLDLAEKELASIYDYINREGSHKPDEAELFFLKYYLFYQDQLNTLRKNTKEHLKDLELAVLHGDIHPENVLFVAQSTVLHIIDFGYSHIGPRIADIANDIQELGQKFNWGRTKKYIETYNETTAQPLTPIEKKLLPEMYRTLNLRHILLVGCQIKLGKNGAAMERWLPLLKNSTDFMEHFESYPWEEISGPLYNKNSQIKEKNMNSGLSLMNWLNSKDPGPVEDKFTDIPLELVALRILFHGSVHFPLTDEEAWSYAESFGVTEEVVRAAIDLAVQIGEENLPQRLVELVKSNLEKIKDINKEERIEYFMRFIFDPYLSLIEISYETETPIGIELDPLVKIEFSRIFKNGISKMIIENFIKNYRSNAPVDIHTFTFLNSLLEGNGYRLLFWNGWGLVYKIARRFPIDSVGIGSVNLVRRLGIQRMPAAHGMSVIYDSNVDILDQSLEKKSDFIERLMKYGNQFMHSLLDSTFSKMVGIDRSKYPKIKILLFRKNFINKNKDEIKSLLLNKVAVHELKHRWDSVKGFKGSGLDSEFSAYLTSIYYTKVPYYALNHWLEEYLFEEYIERISKGYDADTALVEEEIQEVWKVMQEVATLPLDKSDIRLRQWAKERYEHLGNRNPTLTPIEDFEPIVKKFESVSEPSFIPSQGASCNSFSFVPPLLLSLSILGAPLLKGSMDISTSISWWAVVGAVVIVGGVVLGLIARNFKKPDLSPKERKIVEEAKSELFDPYFELGRRNFKYDEESLSRIVKDVNWGMSARDRSVNKEGNPVTLHSRSLMVLPEPNSTLLNNLVRIQDEFSTFPFSGNFFRTPRDGIHFSLVPALRPVQKEKLMESQVEEGRNTFNTLLTGVDSFDTWIEGITICGDSGRILAQVFPLPKGGIKDPQFFLKQKLDTEAKRIRTTITLLTPFQPLTESERQEVLKWVEQNRNRIFGKMPVEKAHYVHVSDSYGGGERIKIYPLGKFGIKTIKQWINDFFTSLVLVIALPFILRLIKKIDNNLAETNNSLNRSIKRLDESFLKYAESREEELKSSLFGKDPFEHNYYTVLGVGRYASTEEIKSTYLEKAELYHPDINPDPGAAEKYRLLSEACFVLSNPRRREIYDERFFEEIEPIGIFYDGQEVWENILDLFGEEKVEYYILLPTKDKGKTNRQPNYLTAIERKDSPPSDFLLSPKGTKFELAIQKYGGSLLVARVLTTPPSKPNILPTIITGLLTLPAAIFDVAKFSRSDSMTSPQPTALAPLHNFTVGLLSLLSIAPFLMGAADASTSVSGWIVAMAVGIAGIVLINWGQSLKGTVPNLRLLFFPPMAFALGAGGAMAAPSSDGKTGGTGSGSAPKPEKLKGMEAVLEKFTKQYASSPESHWSTDSSKRILAKENNPEDLYKKGVPWNGFKPGTYRYHADGAVVTGEKGQEVFEYDQLKIHFDKKSGAWKIEGRRFLRDLGEQGYYENEKGILDFRISYEEGKLTIELFDGSGKSIKAYTVDAEEDPILGLSESESSNALMMVLEDTVMDALYKDGLPKIAITTKAPVQRIPDPLGVFPISERYHRTGIQAAQSQKAPISPSQLGATSRIGRFIKHVLDSLFPPFLRKLVPLAPLQESGARKGVEVEGSPTLTEAGEQHLLNKLPHLFVREDAEVINGMEIPFVLREFEKGSITDLYLRMNGIKGSYHFKNKEDGKTYIFIQKYLKGYKVFLRHELYEIYWTRKLATETLGIGETIPMLAHRLADTLIIAENEWASVKESEYLQNLLGELTEEQFKIIVEDHENGKRKVHEKQRKKYLTDTKYLPEPLFFVQLNLVSKFESSVAEHAKRGFELKQKERADLARDPRGKGSLIWTQGDVQGPSKYITLYEVEGYHKLLQDVSSPQEIPFIIEFERLYAHFKEFTISPEELESLGAAIQKIDEAISHSIRQEREINLIRLRFFESKTLAKIGEQFGALQTKVTLEAVRKAKWHLLMRIRWHLTHHKVQVNKSNPAVSELVDIINPLDFPISIKARLVKLLERRNIKTFEELAQKTREELNQFHNFGDQSMKLVEQILSTRGRTVILEKDRAMEQDSPLTLFNIMNSLNFPESTKTRTLKALKRNKIFTFEDLKQKTRKELSQIKNLGNQSMQIVEKIFALYGETLSDGNDVVRGVVIGLLGLGTVTVVSLLTAAVATPTSIPMWTIVLNLWIAGTFLINWGQPLISFNDLGEILGPVSGDINAIAGPGHSSNGVLDAFKRLDQDKLSIALQNEFRKVQKQWGQKLSKEQLESLATKVIYDGFRMEDLGKNPLEGKRPLIAYVVDPSQNAITVSEQIIEKIVAAKQEGQELSFVFYAQKELREFAFIEEEWKKKGVHVHFESDPNIYELQSKGINLLTFDRSISQWVQDQGGFSSYNFILPKSLHLSYLQDLPADSLLRKAAILFIDQTLKVTPILRYQNLEEIRKAAETIAAQA